MLLLIFFNIYLEFHKNTNNMKFKTLLIALLSFICFSCEKNDINEEEEVPVEPKIYRGDITINYQEDLDAFGAEGYIRVIGHITIGSSFDNTITTLESLRSIEKIEAITLLDTDIKSLDGLNNLTSSGYFAIVGNDELENVKALSNLTSIKGSLLILVNHKLRNLNGLNQVTNITGELHIDDNKNLENINGLENVSSNVDFLLIEQNPKLTKIDGLRKIPSVTRGLSIVLNDALSNIDGLSSIVSVGGTLAIGQNKNLLDVNGLESITAVKRLDIFDNDKLKNLNPLSNLTSLGEFGVVISENNNLDNFCGIRPGLENNEFMFSFIISGNAYNPTKEDILNGNCKI